jgi:hypothetical protein
MSWLTDLFRALGRAAGYVTDNADNPENRPKPVPITTREELGWDDARPPKDPPKGAA